VSACVSESAVCVFVIKAMKMAVATTTAMTAERKTKWQNKLKEKQIKINEKGCKSGGKKGSQKTKKKKSKSKKKKQQQLASKY